MIGAEIPDPFLVAMLAVSTPLVVGLIAWIVREMGRISVQNGRTEERMDDHERRITRLESQ